jgi:hypothetical protein
VTARTITGAALALGLVSPAGPPPPVTPVWVLRADRQSPGAPYVGVIGDSTGSQLAQALAVLLHHRDVGVAIATVGGCQPTDVVLTFQRPEYLRTHRNCSWEAPAKQRAMTARYHPKVVVWSDIVEWSDIQAEDGRTIAAGTAEWRRGILESWDRVLLRLGDADVALVLPSWWAGAPPDYPAGFPVGSQRALFRSWAGRHPDRVTVVDLSPVVCPAGPPCASPAGGVRLRTDHVHYTPEGARRAAEKIIGDVPRLRTLRGPAAGG